MISTTPLYGEYNPNSELHNYICNDSNFVKVSLTIDKNIIISIIKTNVKDNDLQNLCIKRFENLVNVRFINESEVPKIQENLLQDFYNKYFTSFCTPSIYEQYIQDINNGNINKYFKFKSSKKVIFTEFNIDKSKEYLNIPYPRKDISYVDDIFSYELLYRYFFIYSLIIDILSYKELENINYSEIQDLVIQNLRNSLFTGFESRAIYRFDGYTYGELIEELSQLSTSTLSRQKENNNMLIRYGKETQDFEITINNKEFLSTAFLEYIHNSKLKFDVKNPDEAILRQIENEHKQYMKIRITKGKLPNTCVIYICVYGHRTINRVLNADSSPNKIFRELHLWSGMCTDHFTANVLWRVLSRTEQYNNSRYTNIQKSKYKAYKEYLKTLDYSQNTFIKSNIIIMLSKLNKDKQKQIINKHFNTEATKQKAFINKELSRLNTIIAKYSNNDKAIVKFTEEMYNYAY